MTFLHSLTSSQILPVTALPYTLRIIAFQKEQSLSLPGLTAPVFGQDSAKGRLYFKKLSKSVCEFTLNLLGLLNVLSQRSE
jgi:hypothetical protein